MPIETPSDRNYACFVCAEGHSKRLDAACPVCGRPLDVGRTLEGREIAGLRSHPNTLTRYVARGFYGATYRAENAIGHPFAFKLIPVRLYESQGKDFTTELARYRALGRHENIAELFNGGDDRITLLDQTIDIHWIIMEWVEGDTFRGVLERSGDEFSVDDLYAFVLDVASAISRFESANIWHNDLNADNILASELSPDQLETRLVQSRYTWKVVDTGSAVFRRSGKGKVLDDLKFLGRHMQHARNTIAMRLALLTKEDQYFFDEIGSLTAFILDESPGHSAQTARDVVREIKSLYSRRFMLDDELVPHLRDPFGYLNPNDFPDSYIGLLFSDKFQWVQKIVSPEPQSLLLSGPRGCGKTMILKSMSMRSKLRPKREGETAGEIGGRIDREKFAAFFVSARIQVGNNCLSGKLPTWASDDASILAYFHVLYLREVL